MGVFIVNKWDSSHLASCFLPQIGISLNGIKMHFNPHESFDVKTRLSVFLKAQNHNYLKQLLPQNVQKTNIR